ncbi:DNA helicase-2 / ATP-dependent DNA helicase PcrA [Cohnella sp. OV330]|uniref:ATP-dependent DNA helicase n=1 Tax=Cohnella sp. OV330 TaxID=1855288 RepID=UPI0008ED450A|nr:ATP-dependent DNA helicase [Cohnella sp. OV330]SFA75541.1 DNA helicase-2 / ATP-dependent DNA helicase PcrA [Cohnella sp. OV330]
MTTEDILRTNLTEEQYEAVVDESRHILCLACAGSGKSRTLAYKIAYLISKGEAPESIVAFTFTEKAAESIKRRVAQALRKFGLSENYIGLMFIGTLDSFCQKLLGDINAKYRQYDILDRNGLILFLMSRFHRIGMRHGEGRYFKENIIPLADAWQTMNNENIELADIEQYDATLFNRLTKLGEILDHDGYMDFSFAIKLGVRELRKITTKANSNIAKFKHLLVDEYQDINPIQEEFIKTFASHLDMLLVVGDDDQSIYGWRGANVQNILTFGKRYSEVSVHRLLVNFRSTAAIVDGANNFVQRTISLVRLSKEIKSYSDGNIQDLRKLWFEDREDEAEWVAQRIKSLIGTTYVEGMNSDGTEKCRGLSYSDFAILIRSIQNSNGDNRDKQFADALTRHGIPYKTTGEGGIFDRPYAVCVQQAMELLREVGLPREGALDFFATTVLPVFPHANENKFITVLNKWHQNIHASTSAARRKVYPQEFLHDLIDVFNVRNFEDETALRDLGLFSKIILDVEKTYTSIDSSYRYAEMLNFIDNIAKYSYELEPIDYIVKENSVDISTIHKVKGLEYPVVFVVDLIASRFPHKNATYRGKLPEPLMLAAIERGAYGTRLEDEARLFYTAITRAERALYLSGSSHHPDLKRPCKRSAFIADYIHPKLREDKTLDDLAEKIEPQARFDENEFPTDYSSVKSYLTCPYSYKLATIFGYNATVPELFGFGKTSHTILERLHQRFKDSAPTAEEVAEIVESTFLLKHVFPSNDPVNRPGSYERAKALTQRIMTEYSKKYAADFSRLRQDEVRFEISAKEALITGAIDLLLLEDPNRGIITADVIDFKSMETPEDVADYDWRDMSIQVQLYSHAAKEIIGENVETGYIHTLKDNRRTAIPVDEQSVNSAIGVIEWAVKGILDSDFPMRACPQNCGNCDFKVMCAQKFQAFKNTDTPPQINTPSGLKTIAALDMETEE